MLHDFMKHFYFMQNGYFLVVFFFVPVLVAGFVAAFPPFPAGVGNTV